jgi:hypothetical protein
LPSTCQVLVKCWRIAVSSPKASALGGVLLSHALGRNNKRWEQSLYLLHCRTMSKRKSEVWSEEEKKVVSRAIAEGLNGSDVKRKFIFKGKTDKQVMNLVSTLKASNPTLLTHSDPGALCKNGRRSSCCC